MGRWGRGGVGREGKDGKEREGRESEGEFPDFVFLEINHCLSHVMAAKHMVYKHGKKKLYHCQPM